MFYVSSYQHFIKLFVNTDKLQPNYVISTMKRKRIKTLTPKETGELPCIDVVTLLFMYKI